MVLISLPVGKVYHEHQNRLAVLGGRWGAGAAHEAAAERGAGDHAAGAGQCMAAVESRGEELMGFRSDTPDQISHIEKSLYYFTIFVTIPGRILC